MASSKGRIQMRHPATPGPRGGGVYIPEFQRTRLLDATFALVAAEGYKGLTARRVSSWAGVSNKTFYDLFSDREDCFLAAFDYAVQEMDGVVTPAWKGEREWTARVRGGLGALLGFLDGEPALCRLVFVEALGAGPRVLVRRAEVLELLAGVIDEGRVGVKAGVELPALTAEGLLGAVFGVIYARLLRDEPGPLVGLLNPLMATIVLPYRGHRAAAREIARVAPELAGTAGTKGKGGASITPPGRSTPIDFRLTVRTQTVLAAVDELCARKFVPGGRGSAPSNREIADAAGVSDQGQISKLLARLEGLGLLQNTGGETQGVPNAWRLTPRGEQIARVGVRGSAR
jgi:AcrR family transcriptional regulator